MSSGAAPTNANKASDMDLSDYRQNSDIVITVDTGNSVCSTILVEGCSDDLDLSYNDDADGCQKPSDIEDEIPEEIPKPKRLRTRSSKSAAKSNPSPPKRSKRLRKARAVPVPPPRPRTRKGMAYIRSAFLSSDEITHEVLHRSKADTPKPREASLFTAKLMMRLASRLPPSRARPTCEELKELMNSQKDNQEGSVSNKCVGLGTPLRVKAEKPSFCETFNHVMQVPAMEEENDWRSDPLFNVCCTNIHCREERERKIYFIQKQTLVKEEEDDDDEDRAEISSLSIESLQQALKDTNGPNKKEIEKQIALIQLESLRGRRGRPPYPVE